MPYGTVSAIIITITGIADNFICCNFVFLFLYLSFKIKVQKNSINNKSHYSFSHLYNKYLIKLIFFLILNVSKQEKFPKSLIFNDLEY